MPSLSELPSKQLVAIYNLHSDTPVDKFTDKATGIRRVENLLAKIEVSVDDAIAAAAQHVQATVPVSTVGATTVTIAAEDPRIEANNARLADQIERTVEDNLAHSDLCAFLQKIAEVVRHAPEPRSPRKAREPSQPRAPRVARDWTVKPIITSPTNQATQRLIDRIEAARGKPDDLRAFRFKRTNSYSKMAGNYLDALLAEATSGA